MNTITGGFIDVKSGLRLFNDNGPNSPNTWHNSLIADQVTANHFMMNIET